MRIETEQQVTAGSRAIVSDDGSMISLTAYGQDGAVLRVQLSSLRALGLADELLRAAIPKLGDVPKTLARPPIEEKPSKRRGGDPRTTRREQRHEALRELHKLTGPGKSLRAWSAETARRLARFRPIPEETSPERQLMQEINNPELPPAKQISQGEQAATAIGLRPASIED